MQVASAYRINEALERLRAAESARRLAIYDLVRLGFVRSHRFVADIGESLAAAFLRGTAGG